MMPSPTTDHLQMELLQLSWRLKTVMMVDAQLRLQVDLELEPFCQTKTAGSLTQGFYEVLPKTM